MGNVPTKEERSCSVSSATGRTRRGSSISSSISQRIGISGSKSVITANGSATKKPNKERELFKTLHTQGLIVKFDENVDGGYLAPYGTYNLNLDYKVSVVKECIIERKLAPFFTPLQEYDEDWTDEKLLKVIDSLDLHSPIEGEEDDEDLAYDADSVIESVLSKKELKKHLSKKFNKELKLKKIKWQNEENERFKNECNSKQLFSRDLKLFLYRNILECPICFLYYPKWVNYTRCCNQAICTECSVQIKRLDPHFPHDEEGDEANNNDEAKKNPNLLISEPAACPYCATPHFGVTYQQPTEFKTGLGGISPASFTNNANRPITGAYGSPIKRHHDSISENQILEITSTSPLNPQENYFKSHRKSSSAASNVIKRRGSIPVTHPQVISTDYIRPDWESKLLNARATLAKRAAAANVIHASNLLLQDHEDDLEQRMIEEAMRLSLLDQETRRRRESSSRRG